MKLIDTLNKKKLSKLILTYSVVFLIGCLYAFIAIPNGIHLRCPFNAITGLECPGCGITGVCLSIINGDLARAIKCNTGLCIVSPLIIFLVVDNNVRYILDKPSKEHKILTIFTLIFLIIWGIIRNILSI